MIVNLDPILIAALRSIVDTIDATERAVDNKNTPRAGQVIVDVGAQSDEAKFTGSLNPDTLDRLDWAYWSRTPGLSNRYYDLFDRKPWMGDRTTGMLYHPGDLATADLSGYWAAGSKFGPYL